MEWTEFRLELLIPIDLCKSDPVYILFCESSTFSCGLRKSPIASEYYLMGKVNYLVTLVHCLIASI